MFSTKTWTTWAMAVVLTAFGALASSCGGGSAKMMTPACAAGNERCPCYPNLTCNTGLVCLSDLCVSGTPGTGGAGGGINPGTGGVNPGTGGVSPGTGGVSPGSGGVSPGTGGVSPGSGGVSPGSGGVSPGSGGVSGSGGSAGGNLLKNGDFSQGKEYWVPDLNAGSSGAYSTNNEFCVYNQSDLDFLSFSLGNPPTPSDAVNLQAGATYTISYRAYGTYQSLQLPTVEVKIGGVEAPYPTDYSTTDVVSNSTYATFTHQFTATTGDATAGLVFNATIDYYPSQICFDDVKLVKN